MSSSPCPRTWQAEAIEDGRIDAKDRESFERHLDGCELCTAELKAIRALRQHVVDLPTPDPGDLERRRQRAALLRRANDSLTGASRPRSSWVFAAATLIATAAAAATTVVVTRQLDPSPAPPPSGSIAPALSAAPQEAHRRDHASPSAEPNSSAESAPTNSAPPATASSDPTSASSGNTTPPTSTSSSPTVTAGSRFAEAMAAFSAGNHGQAESLFGAFIRDFPRDARTEDASFLQIQCKLRRGDRAGASSLAKAYLRAYPRGLRRPEVERYAGVAPGGSVSAAPSERAP